MRRSSSGCWDRAAAAAKSTTPDRISSPRLRSMVFMPSLAPVSSTLRSCRVLPSLIRFWTASVFSRTSKAATRPVAARQELLVDDRRQRVGQLYADLLLLLAREHIHDPIDRLGRIVGVQ